MKYALAPMLLLVCLFSACIWPRPTPGPVVSPVEMVTQPLTLPYSISLSNPVQMQDSLQSFALAEYNGYWLIVGGRTSGFHGTGGPDRTFPVKHANKQFIVYQPTTGNRWAAPLPAAHAEQLSSTNMPFVQDGNTLWLTGGYGCMNQSSHAPCYQTYDLLTAIDVPGMINALIAEQTSDLGQFITSIQDARFQVTGGVMAKMNDYFYLVMGQNYDTIYVNGITGQYTEEIRRFQAEVSNGAIAISDYSSVQNPVFHRRDLNVLEAVRPDGTVGLNVLAGVFQPNAQGGAAWPHPVLIDEDPNTGRIAYRHDTSFTQNWNAYDSGNVLLYDAASKTMYTSLLGGITGITFDENGKPWNGAGFLPWSKYVSTVVQFPDGTTKEYPQYSPALPGFIGAAGDMVLNPAVPLVAGTKGVIDYAKLPSGDNLVGWFYGGIISTAVQSNAVSDPTFSSSAIYEVHLSK
ncbi:MAG: hypothetical protein AB8H12_02210 [Lewinella sp.]